MEASACPPSQSSPLRHYPRAFPHLQHPRAGGARRERAGRVGVAHYEASQRNIPSQAKIGRNSNPPPPPPQRIKKKDTFRKEIGLVASTPRVPMLFPHFTGDSCWQPKDPQGPTHPEPQDRLAKGGVGPWVSTAHPLRPRTPRGRWRGR